MKIEKNVNIKTNLNLNNLQNNQRKEKFKRTMFGISNIRKLKKSGDLLSTTDNKSIIKVGDNTSVRLKLKSFDLANRLLATYGIINKNYIFNLKENELNTNNNVFSINKAKLIAKIEEALKQEKISKDQFLVILKRINAIDLSYAHATISDIIEESVEDNEEYVTIIYHVITTKNTVVDYGGPNKFYPIFLYHNKETNVKYYTISLTYLQKLKKKDYIMFYVLKNKEAFKNDTDEVQNNLAYNIKKVSEIKTFQMLDVNEKCLKDISFNEIIPDEAFPVSIYNNKITGYVPSIPYLFD